MISVYRQYLYLLSVVAVPTLTVIVFVLNACLLSASTTFNIIVNVCGLVTVTLIGDDPDIFTVTPSVGLVVTTCEYGNFAPLTVNRIGIVNGN